MPAAFCCVLFASNANAGLDIPHNPLTTASRVPPNIMFILDNSGSMALVSMPTLSEDFDVQPSDYSGTATGATRSGLRDNPHDRSYLNNAVYYNPSVSYQPWMKADGTRMTGGQSVENVYSNWNSLTGSRDLRNNAESIFYVPHGGVAPSTSPDPRDYDRYQVRNVGGVSRVMRGSGEVRTLASNNWNDRNVEGREWWYATFEVPAGTTTLTVRARNGSGGNADLYLRRGARPTTGDNDAASAGTGNTETVVVSGPEAGTWHIGVYNSTGSRLRNEDIQAVAEREDWEEATPTGRSQEDELTNIATWYSYYRTRMKTAKAGALEAFVSLGREVRVGYTPINGRSTYLQAGIPVNTEDGVFTGANKTSWFNQVMSEIVRDGSTPLRSTLDDVGKYFKRSDSSGPYGPQSGLDQLACRQNFSILTTDGYWNDSTSSTFGLGDDDGDGHRVTLADIANYYYRTDLRTNLPNNVPASTSDPADWQHMVTFAISIGLKGTLEPTNPPPAGNAAIWPNPMQREDATRIDDLWHAAVNGHGKFVAASDPKAFTEGLQAALAEIQSRTSSFSNVATNSVSLEAGSMVFNASYVSGTWSGVVTARALDANGVGDVVWTSTIPESGRKIFTAQRVAGALVGRAFPTSEQRDRLERSGGPAEFPVSGADNAAYIAGARNREQSAGGTLRNRSSVLGDIVGSSPAYVEETGTLYVGANDGMLHAFDAGTGRELFAFIPEGINWADLATLSRPDYAHRFFVDGPIAVSSRKLTPGQNILVGTLGKGGKGLYSLDVSDPANFNQNSFNWELKDTPGGNMGLVLGRPLLTRLRDGTAAAIVANGPNSTNERAVLVVVDLDTGAVIREISTGVGSAAAPNGLMAVTGVYGADGKTLAYVYAGDLQGNVWKFDLSAESSASWSVSRLFTAVDDSGKPQPITGAIAVATHPGTYERWVFFGTGRFLTSSDASEDNRDVQSMYGFVDRDDGEAVERDDLTERRIAVAGMSGGFEVRGFQKREELPEDSSGWYIDLVEPSGAALGERIVQDAQIVSRLLVTASMVPTGDACESDGSGYINALDAFTGTSASLSYFDLNGMNGTKDETVGSGSAQVPVGSVDVGNGMPTLPNLLRGLIVVGGTGSGEVKDPSTLKPTWGRVSWHEIRKE